jgi:thioester reductase-like protein
MLLKSATLTGCLPCLEERLTWLPVDLCAQAILEVAARTTETSDVVQLCNTHDETTWSNLLAVLRDEGLAFEEVEPVEWLERLEASEADEQRNPARKLLPLWKSAVRRLSNTQADFGKHAARSTARMPRAVQCRSSRSRRHTKRRSPCPGLQPSIALRCSEWRVTLYLRRHDHLPSSCIAFGCACVSMGVLQCVTS